MDVEKVDYMDELASPLFHFEDDYSLLTALCPSTLFSRDP